MGLQGFNSVVIINRAPLPDHYLLTLRNALLATFSSHSVITATDDISVAKNASIMPLFASIVTAFQMHARKDVIRTMIEYPNFPDDPDLADLQGKLLGLNEWETDTSDAT